VQRPSNEVRKKIFLFLLLCLSCHPNLFAAPLAIRVPADKPTIQQALDSATDGEMVVVSAGTYHELLDFHGKALTVASEAGPANTIIDGDFSGAVVTFQTGEGRDSVLTGFTIQKGLASSGGGVTISGASPSIIGNIFENNWQSPGGFGAAIGANGASPLIRQNTFRNNHCDNQPFGGVLSFVNSSAPVVANNILIENDGRALNFSLPDGTSAKVLNNLISGNADGIRVSTHEHIAALEFYNNILVRNGSGLVIDCGEKQDQPVWSHNLVYQNGTNYLGLASQTGIEGNISIDPLLACPPGGDFHLAQGSPCIDAGDASAADCGDTDFEGNPRKIDGHGDSAETIDLGPYEFNPSMAHSRCLYVICPSNIVVHAVAGFGSAVVNYRGPFGPPEATVLSSPPSGSVFAAGTTTVTCQAILGTNTSVGHFTVTVLVPPPNDEVTSATTISSVPYSKIQDTSLATAGLDDVFCGGIGGSVWYRLPAHESADIYVETAGSDYEVSVSVFTGTPGHLTQIGCAFGQLKFQATAGQVYSIMLSPFFRTTGGQLRLTVRATPLLRIKVLVDGRVRLDPRTGAVTIRGTIKSNRPASVYLGGMVSQSRGRNRAGASNFLTSTDCTGTSAWTATIARPMPGFDPGMGALKLSGFAFDYATGDVADTRLGTVVIFTRDAGYAPREQRRQVSSGENGL
jgi:hypothetical protein